MATLSKSIFSSAISRLKPTQKLSKTKLLGMVLLSTVLVGCNAKPKIDSSELAKAMNTTQAEFENMVNSLDTREKIMSHYANWKGVKYRLGGSSRKGIDCSGFVQLTFKEKFGVQLPRSTREQQKIGTKIAKTDLINGDIVVFNAGSTGRHVGIYIGNNKFVHASTSVGVTISDMNDSYWKNRFNEARRILSSKSMVSASISMDSKKESKDSSNKALFKEKNKKYNTNS